MIDLLLQCSERDYRREVDTCGEVPPELHDGGARRSCFERGLGQGGEDDEGKQMRVRGGRRGEDRMPVHIYRRGRESASRNPRLKNA